MNIKCENCGNFYPETDAKCPACGAANPRAAQADVPRTIEELKGFCRSKNMPLERMRFFIGEDYREPKAFGIYKDENDRFVVYKNKADGSRAVRYEGPDEAYAVNELYQKLKSEVTLRREQSAAQRAPMDAKRRRRQSVFWFAVLLAIILAIDIFFYIHDTREGYYYYDDDYYYYLDDDWYYYDMDGWILAESIDEALRDGASEYYQGDSYSDHYGVEDFSDTEYYHESESSDSDWDTDYDSWDSSDTDWSSDW